MELIPRKDDKPVITYVNPYVEINVGLWILFVAATTFLGLRLWSKMNQRHGLWYDDHILIGSWVSACALHRPLAFPVLQDIGASTDRVVQD